MAQKPSATEEAPGLDTDHPVRGRRYTTRQALVLLAKATPRGDSGQDLHSIGITIPAVKYLRYPGGLALVHGGPKACDLG